MILLNNPQTVRNRPYVSKGVDGQEKPTHCGTKAADVLDKLWSRQTNANPLIILVHLQLLWLHNDYKFKVLPDLLPFGRKCVKCGHPRLNGSREITPDLVGSGIFDSVFRYNLRPEIDNDVISSLSIDCIGIDVQVKFGDSRSNGSRDIPGGDFVPNKRIWRRLPMP